MRIQIVLLSCLLAGCVSCTEAPPERPSGVPSAPTTKPAPRHETAPATRPAPAVDPATRPAGPTAVVSPHEIKPAPASKKIELDLTKLDANGLGGPTDGKVCVSYEFAIPNTAKCKAEVRAIDKSVRFMPGSRGRIRAGKDECLCIGETNAEFRTVLGKLADLPYIKRIIECHWE